MKLPADQYFLRDLRDVQTLSYSSLFVSLRDFQLITQNSSKNIASRQSRCAYVNARHRLDAGCGFYQLDQVCHLNSFCTILVRVIKLSPVGRIVLKTEFPVLKP